MRNIFSEELRPPTSCSFIAGQYRNPQQKLTGSFHVMLKAGVVLWGGLVMLTIDIGNFYLMKDFIEKTPKSRSDFSNGMESSKYDPVV